MLVALHGCGYKHLSQGVGVITCNITLVWLQMFLSWCGVSTCVAANLSLGMGQVLVALQRCGYKQCQLLCLTVTKCLQLYTVTCTY